MIYKKFGGVFGPVLAQDGSERAQFSKIGKLPTLFHVILEAGRVAKWII